MKEGKYTLKSEKTDQCELEDDEIISGICFGQRKSHSIVNFQFILKRI